MSKFKVGDIVEAWGCRGVVDVVEISSETDYRVRVEFPNCVGGYWFTADGRGTVWHKEPSLKLIERPKRKVKKTIERWVNVYNTGYVGVWNFTSEHTAGDATITKRVACVKLTGEYEIEESEE